jgi:Domain of unknown function (DUF397)
MSCLLAGRLTAYRNPAYGSGSRLAAPLPFTAVHFPVGSGYVGIRAIIPHGMLSSRFDHLRCGVVCMSRTKARESILIWRKSSYSIPNGACLEAAVIPGIAMVRDSADRAGCHLRFPEGGWREFIAQVKTGRLPRFAAQPRFRS